METILVIEDEPDLRADLAEELAAGGYRVLQAADGEDGLRMIVAERPDLVLCDISMPGLSGFEVVRLLRERHPECSEIPVVFLSALADRKDVIAGMQGGADDYLTKPVDFDHLQAVVASRLRQVSRLKALHRAQRSALEDTLLRMLREQRARSVEVAAAALDALSIATFLLADRGHLVLANEAGRSLLARGRPLVVVNGAIEARRPADARLLQAAIADACTGRATQDGAALKLVDGDAGPTMIAVAVPMAVGDAAVPHEPRCVMFVVDLSTRQLPRIDHFAEAHELTSAEGRVLRGIVEGRSPSEIADQTGVSRNTVATQLASIFRKTNVNRQSELVAVALLSSVWR